MFRAFNLYRDAAVEIGYQQHPGSAKTNLYGTPNQAVFIHHRQINPEAILSAGVDQNTFGIGAPGNRNHPRGDKGGDKGWSDIEQFLKPLVFHYRPLGNKPVLLQP